MLGSAHQMETTAVKYLEITANIIFTAMLLTLLALPLAIIIGK